ncbi:MAG: aminomethyl-transferring glycine dehydrogenase subunit GcvPA [Desulfobacteraceae bacterium]|nr:MAG: aminomethyl-transferring glycine dehydrogenase subunit GcvPA [Desulfobacteraceae bacterium]
MRYLPHTGADIQTMLKAVGARDLDDLFAHIPSDCRRRGPLELPPALSEWELDRHMEALAAGTAVDPAFKIFLGAGSYDHYIPETIKQLLRRGELNTAYTPYQAEVSQGTLQAIYEYQTLICRLLGMEVANASMYDGASALAEALLMAIRLTKRRRVALSRAIHPLYRRVVETYFRPAGFEIVLLPYGSDGRTDLSALSQPDELAAVAVQSPNFFGCIEDLKTLDRTVHTGAASAPLMIVAFTEPLAYGLYRSPGEQGADLVCGEGQSLGMARSFGGPGLGLFTCRMQHARNMPGRLVGKTVDAEGRRGFVLTLSTREQHIRRERATSNICTNQGLCATAAAMYLASLGGSGLRQLARLNYDRAGYLKSALQSAGVTVPFSAPVFNEFVVRLPSGCYRRLLDRKIIAGLPLARFYPELPDHYVLCATETGSKEDLDFLVKEATA